MYAHNHAQSAIQSGLNTGSGTTISYETTTEKSLVVAIILIIVNIWNTISFLMPMIDL